MKSMVHKLLEGWIGMDTDVKISSAPGGDIHNSYSAEYVDEAGVRRLVFVKMNVLAHQAVLHSEYRSLLKISEHSAVSDCQPLHYPRALYFKTDSEAAYFVMTHHSIRPLESRTSPSAGWALARQHRITSDKFGWGEDNHIGTTPQLNASGKNWPVFFRDCRLIPQLELAIGNGLANATVHNINLICAQIDDLLAERTIQPCLLHGDLWGGNIGFDSDVGKPIFFDPAPYFGDPEVDLAMTHLFGGFEPGFYRAYYSEQVAGAATEKVHAVYNLYHALNHFNLFGHNYQTLVDRLVYQTGFVSQLTNFVKTT